jgi:hypothetical protein
VRVAAGCFACVTALTSLAVAESPSSDQGAAAPAPTYYLHGYYKLLDQRPTWQYSDASPWQVVRNEPWVQPRLVKWGYVPMTHDSQRYYCLIDDRPRTGSHVIERTFICGDPATAEWIFNSGRRPTLALYGGGR